ncbi:MAG: hypothetical protein IPP80_03395 [Ignavibacteria bacterium]|nr:hypothetical protein [Ignavibacteria bacterium]
MDLAERVKKKLRVELDVFTFHKLGLDIVSKCEGAKPALAAFVGSLGRNVSPIVIFGCRINSFVTIYPILGLFLPTSP